MLHQMRYDSDILEPENLAFPSPKLQEKEIGLALELVDHLSAPFNPDRYHDTYTQELRRVIREKARGRMPLKKGKMPTKTRTADLMRRLQESVREEHQQTKR